MAGFLTVLRADLKSPAPLIAWVVLSLIIGISGPFGSYVALQPGPRLLYWFIFVGVGILVGMVIRAVVHGLWGLRDFQRGAFLVALLATVVLTPPLYFLADAVFDHARASTPSMADMATFIFAVSLSLGAFRHSVADAVPHFAEVALAVPAEPELPLIVQRLDPALQGRLVALTVRDHYVDVYTTAGQGAVLIRLGDAIREAAPEDGDQIHRSHWVAWWAVTGVEREGGKHYVRLCPAQRLPVSKTHLAKLEERGLLEREPA